MTPLQFAILIGASACLSVALFRFARISPRQAIGAGHAIAWLGFIGLAAVVFVNLCPPEFKPHARVLVRALGTASVVCAGVAVGLAVSVLVKDGSRNADRILLTGLSLHAAATFLGFEIGKLVHDAEMRVFFLQSGLPVWFMYCVMAIEIAGAIGLCLSRWRLGASVALAAVMVGAIGTHVRNGDPIGDSLDAIRMLALTGSIAWIGFADLRRRRGMLSNSPA